MAGEGVRRARAADRRRLAIADVADPAMAAAGKYATRGVLAVPRLERETDALRGGPSTLGTADSSASV